jgi:DNA replication and repair protein RecF
MQLAQLEIKNLRCVVQCRLHLSSRLNVIWGPNASGKTTLLESIYFLGRARSFRTRQAAQLIRNGERDLSIFAQLRSPEGRLIPLGVARSQDELEIRLAGRALKQSSELASCLPLLLINKDSHQVLERGADQRRRLLDWGAFHTDPHFIMSWQRYQRALKQRNEALRQGEGRASVSAWDRELAEAAEQIHQHRAVYISRLHPVFQERMQILLEHDRFALEYCPGWPTDKDLAEVLRHSFERDRLLGYTQAGPHRADLGLTVGGVPAVQRLSSGEQKLLLCALRLAQLALKFECTGEPSVILVDDLPAELDVVNRKRLLEELLCLEGQVFVTTTDIGLLDVDPAYPCKMFHVEQGTVNEYTI